MYTITSVRKKINAAIGIHLLVDQRIELQSGGIYTGCGHTKMYYKINLPGIGRDRFIELAKSWDLLNPKYLVISVLGDGFTVDVKKDAVYNTPVFGLVSGVTSVPRNQARKPVIT